MSPALPLPVRAVAGLAAWTLDEARRLPTRLVSLPVRAAGAAMQTSLRLQQEYAGLVARGDELLLQLRGKSEQPPAWATFDEDGPAPPPSELVLEPAEPSTAVSPFLTAPGAAPSAFDLVEDTHTIKAAVTDQAGAPAVAELPAAAAPVPGYDGWTVAQLRARLRRLSSGQLADLLTYEQAGRQRAPYLTMLRNRLAAPLQG